METEQKPVPVMIVGVDDSEHSFYALEWTLDHFLTPSAPNSPFKLIVVHSKPSPTSAIGFAGPGAADVFPFVDADLKKIAARVVERAKELCHSKSVDDVNVEVVEGDARNVLCIGFGGFFPPHKASQRWQVVEQTFLIIESMFSGNQKWWSIGIKQKGKHKIKKVYSSCWKSHDGLWRYY